MAWLNTGTHDALLEASNFIETIEKRQGLKVASLEELAFRHGWVTATQLHALAGEYGKSSYADYLRQLVGLRDLGTPGPRVPESAALGTFVRVFRRNQGWLIFDSPELQPRLSWTCELSGPHHH
jgi:hypothetical protein